MAPTSLPATLLGLVLAAALALLLCSFYLKRPNQFLAGSSSADPTSESSPSPETKRRMTKGAHIEDLRALDKEMIRLDHKITKHEYHTWRNQQPRYPKQAENLTKMSHEFEAMKKEAGFEAKKGEKGFEKYYENLRRKETWEVRRTVRIANKWLDEVNGTFAAMEDAVDGRNAGRLQTLVDHT